MLKKAFVIGACFVALIGCTGQIPQKSQQTQPEALMTEVPQESTGSAESKEVETRRKIALSSIKQLEQQTDLLSQKMLGRQQKISDLELKKNQLEADIRAYNSKVQSFLVEHKNAASCMGAVGASLDESNQYSKDVKDIASLVTVVCGIGVLSNEEFRNEVFFVVDQLTQADSHVKNLNNDFKAIQSQIYTENESLAQEKSEVSRLTADIQKQQSQLEI
jgi:predicted  nucleic acid-binding Zn-ribbon protein